MEQLIVQSNEQPFKLLFRVLGSLLWQAVLFLLAVVTKVFVLTFHRQDS